MTENSYDRYKRVLQEIAAGAENPSALAKDALVSRKLAPTYQWKTTQEERKNRAKIKRDERKERAGIAYENWLAAGRPPIAAYARTLNMKRQTLVRLLRHAEKGWPWEWKRLGHTKNRNYRTAGEIHSDYWKEQQ